MRSACLLAVAVLAVLMVASMFQPVAAHVGTLDQQQTLICDARRFDTTVFPGQTFTAGLSGPLTEVDLVIGCETSDDGSTCASMDPLTVEIHSGDPNGDKLGSSSLPGSAFPYTPSGFPSVFVSFTFSPPPTVVAGSVYAIVITTREFGRLYVVGDCNANPYPDGTEWVNSRSGPSPGWRQYLDRDLAFKTYVAAAEGPVGGVVIPANSFALVAPWLGVIGVVGCIGTAVVVARRKK